jgi:hypothetical protein
MCAVLRSWKPYVTSSPLQANVDQEGNVTYPPFSVEMVYNGTKMILDFMKGSSVYDPNVSKKHLSVQNKVYHYFYHESIPLWFTVQKYVLLTRHNGEWYAASCY